MNQYFFVWFVHNFPFVLADDKMGKGGEGIKKKFIVKFVVKSFLSISLITNCHIEKEKIEKGREANHQDTAINCHSINKCHTITNPTWSHRYIDMQMFVYMPKMFVSFKTGNAAPTSKPLVNP